MGETSKYRNLFEKYTKGNGIELGFGGDAINDTVITIDLKERYTTVGGCPQNLYGDASNLYWFKDNVFDYVYSSHLIEDFMNTRFVVEEWLRVLKVSGNLCLLFPDEQKYRSMEKPEYWNQAHKYADFGMKFLLPIVQSFNSVEIIETKEFLETDYNCMIIAKKIK